MIALAHRLADDLARSFRQHRDDLERERERERVRFQQELLYEQKLATERTEKALLTLQLDNMRTQLRPPTPGQHSPVPGGVNVLQFQPAGISLPVSQPPANHQAESPESPIQCTSAPSATDVMNEQQATPTHTVVPPAPLRQPVSQPAVQTVAAADTATVLSHASDSANVKININTADESRACELAASAAKPACTSADDSSKADSTSDVNKSLQVTATPTVLVHQIRTPKPYSGKSNWKLYKQHFERVAKINKWHTNTEKFQYLSLALESPATEVLIDIDENSDSAYMDVWDALAKRFGSIEDQREAMRRFDSRKQNSDESIAEFVQALKMAYHDAWPLANADTKDTELKRKFEDGIRCTEMKHYLRLHARNDKFGETVNKARHFEALLNSGTNSKKSVNIITSDPPEVNSIHNTNVQDILDNIESIVQKVLDRQIKSRSFKGNERELSGSVSTQATPKQQNYKQQSQYRPQQIWSQRPSATFGTQSQTTTGQHYTRPMSNRPLTPPPPAQDFNWSTRRPKGCWTCGRPRCHSDRHVNDQTMTAQHIREATQPSQPPRTSSNQGNWPRSSFQQGSRTPTHQNRPASR